MTSISTHSPPCRQAPPVSVTPQAIQQPSCAIAVPAIRSNAWHQGPNPLRIGSWVSSDAQQFMVLIEKNNNHSHSCLYAHIIIYIYYIYIYIHIHFTLNSWLKNTTEVTTDLAANDVEMEQRRPKCIWSLYLRGRRNQGRSFNLSNLVFDLLIWSKFGFWVFDYD